MAEISVGSTDDISEGSSRIVVAGEKQIAVFNINGEFVAITNTCPHRGGSLGDGFVSGTTVTCPLHGWAFDVFSGKCALTPNISVKTYDIEIRGDEVILII